MSRDSLLARGRRRTEAVQLTDACTAHTVAELFALMVRHVREAHGRRDAAA